MRLPRIYLDEVFTEGAHLKLPSEARHHLVNVLRLKVGDPLILFDGKSQQEAIASITLLDRKSATVSVQSIESTCRESFLDISLIQALSSADKMDFTIQKAVELGAKSIRPIVTERSQKLWKSDRLEKKRAHWNGIVVHACEQSGRTHLPQLYSPVSYQEYLALRFTDRPALILEPSANQTIKEIKNKSGAFDILVGPEGGFTPQELLQAETAGIPQVKLGPRILRTETAGVAILTWLQIQHGDLA